MSFAIVLLHQSNLMPPLLLNVSPVAMSSSLLYHLLWKEKEKQRRRTKSFLAELHQISPQLALFFFLTLKARALIPNISRAHTE